MGEPFLVLDHGAAVALVWKHDRVWVTFDQLKRHGATEWRAEVEVGIDIAPQWRHRVGLTLQSAAAHLSIAKDLQAGPVGLGVDRWRRIVSSSCWAVIDRQRRGVPAVELGRPDWVQPAQRWLVDRWIPAGLPTIMFGDGGVGKSLLGLAIAICARTGHALGGDPNWRVSPVSGVLVLDWESDRDDHEERLRLLAAGLGVAVPDGIFYRRMEGALADHVDPIAEEIRRTQIPLVLIDSITPACGAELEASETAIRFFEAVRHLGCTALCYGHVNKAQSREGSAKAQIFGSVHFRNLTRSSFQIVAEEAGEANPALITFRLDKANRLPPPFPPPAGWAITYTTEAITVRPASASEETMGIGRRILEALRHLGRATVSELTDAVDANRDTVKKTLQRLEKQDKVEGEPGHAGGKGQERQWWPKDITGTPNRDILGQPEEPPF